MRESAKGWELPLQMMALALLVEEDYGKPARSCRRKIHGLIIDWLSTCRTSSGADRPPPQHQAPCILLDHQELLGRFRRWEFASLLVSAAPSRVHFRILEYLASQSGGLLVVYIS